MTVIEIGCCGAYCKTCPAFRDGSCRGCKLGYDKGRDISKARCWIKVCCFRDKGLETCADCPEYACKKIREWHQKGYKYGRYKKSTEFIREMGYEKFLKKADKWKGPYGRLD
ncbi:MAG: DUF3795 domain-containing protein [Candidatus Altiarchaeota archaeon]|nr:DUF3795 domain-containing protein [Candidatus Altiarchaeota archaeon]